MDLHNDKKLLINYLKLAAGKESADDCTKELPPWNLNEWNLKHSNRSNLNTLFKHWTGNKKVFTIKK